MVDNRVAGTLFVDMKYVFLYHKLGYVETNSDVYVKTYSDVTVTIESEAQRFSVLGKNYPLTHHRDFVILELLDLLLTKGYDVDNLVIDDDGITLTGKKDVRLLCEQWGKDYARTVESISLSPGEAVYTSRLSGGLIDREYAFNNGGEIVHSGLIENAVLYDFTPRVREKSGTYPAEFKVIDDVLIEYSGKDESVTVPEGIVKLEAGAFWNNCNVKRIHLPDTLEVIGGDAFAYCYELEAVNIPSSVIDIGDDPYAGCPKLLLTNDSSEFVLQDGVLFTKDMTRLIHYTPSLLASEYTIPDTVRWVGKHSFYNCNSLDRVTIGKNVDYMGNNPFSDCHKLTLINHSPNFRYVDGALMNKDMTVILHYSHGRDEDEYIMPDTVRTIGRNSFWNCQRLKRIRLGKNLRQIGYNPFANCSNLTIESESPNYVVVDGILYDSTIREVVCCTDVSARRPVVLPDTVENIGRNSFSGCHSLKSITIPDSVNTISRGAFSNCSSLGSVYIPDSVELIEKWAFSYCTSLRRVSMPKGTSLNQETFAGCTDVKVEYR